MLIIAGASNAKRVSSSRCCGKSLASPSLKRHPSTSSSVAMRSKLLDKPQTRDLLAALHFQPTFCSCRYVKAHKKLSGAQRCFVEIQCEYSIFPKVSGHSSTSFSTVRKTLLESQASS